MRAADGLHVEWVDEEAVVLDEENTQLHYLNSSAATLYALIQEVGFDAAMDEVRQKFGNGPFDAGEIEMVVEEMVAKGLLVDD